MRLLLTTAAGLCLLSAGAIAQTSTPPAPNQMLAQPGTSAGSSSRSSATPSSLATQGLTEGRQSSNDSQNRSTLAENNNENGYGDDNDSKGNGGNWGGRGWRNDEGNWGGGMGPGMRGDHMGWRDHGRWHHGRMGWGGEDRDGAMRGGMKGHGAFFAFRSKEGGFMVRCAGDESTHSCVQAIMPLLNRVETMHNGQSGGGSSNNNGGANKSTGGDNPSNQ